MDIKVIRTRDQHEAALSTLDRLMHLDPDPETPEADDLQLLALLIGDYEQKNFPIDPPDPIEAIKFRMEQQGLRQRDLIPFVGSKSNVSEVLSRKRPLSLPMIRALSAGLDIPVGILAREPEPAPEGEEHIERGRSSPARSLPIECSGLSIGLLVSNLRTLLRVLYVGRSRTRPGNVFLPPIDREVLISNDGLDQISYGDNSDDLLSLHDRQVTDALVRHEGQSDKCSNPIPNVTRCSGSDGRLSLQSKGEPPASPLRTPTLEPDQLTGAGHCKGCFSWETFGYPRDMAIYECG